MKVKDLLESLQEYKSYYIVIYNKKYKDMYCRDLVNDNNIEPVAGWNPDGEYSYDDVKNCYSRTVDSYTFVPDEDGSQIIIFI